MGATITVARNAMGTRFEVLLYGENEGRLRAAGEEALDEIERLDTQLSLYRPESDLNHINRRAAFEPIRVEPQLFRLLQRAEMISQQTMGAFDITAGPLVRCWGFMAGSGAMPDDEQIDDARTVTGFELVELDETNLTIQFKRKGVMLDLGSIGKGYAVDRAIEILREAGIENALLHGGTSTSAVLGRGPDEHPWRVAIAAPPEMELMLDVEQPFPQTALQTLAFVELENEALSVSALWGKGFVAKGNFFGHIIDPRTGRPGCRSVLSAVVTESAADSDALSTALLIEGSSSKWPVQLRIHRHLTCHYVARKLEIISTGIQTIKQS